MAQPARISLSPTPQRRQDIPKLQSQCRIGLRGCPWQHNLCALKTLARREIPIASVRAGLHHCWRGL
eukprot:8737870-Alexandrium_andersonii.AAC.2